MAIEVTPMSEPFVPEDEDEGQHNIIYSAGGLTFDSLYDWDPEYAQQAIEAWTAWLEFITTHEQPK